MKKQILIGIANKLENIDPKELWNQLQAKKARDIDGLYEKAISAMANLDVDDLYGKALSAVQKHWDQNYVMSEEEKSAFVVHINQITHKDSNPIIKTPNLQHKY